MLGAAGGHRFRVDLGCDLPAEPPPLDVLDLSGCFAAARVVEWALGCERIGSMAGERTIPLLPCASIDEIRDFYVPLGFEVTYRQLRPYPCLGLQRDDLALQYFGLDGFRAEDSYGSCIVIVPDTEPLFDAFAAGLRAQFGRLPLTGFPRITRPRRRKNTGNLSGFSLVDPSGNWIRVFADNFSSGGDVAAVAPSRLAGDLANAVVLADSKGDTAQALKILGAGVERHPDADPVDRVEALAFLAELCVRNGDQARAESVCREADAVIAELDGDQLTAVAVTAAQLRELRETL